MFELWDFQRRDVDFAFDSVGTPIHVAPCGSGKTVMQCHLAKREMDRGNYTAILTPRIELFRQTHGTASAICGSGNIAELRADGHWNRNKPIHIVSWNTLARRSKRSDAWFPYVQRVLVDECHLSMAPQIRRVLEYYRDKGVRIDGYTATPGRKSGKGLGSFYSEIKHATSVRQLIKEGKLKPLEYWGGALPDVAKIKSRGGDYVVGELSEACALLVGDVIDNWLRLARERHTVVFAVDIAHCEMLNDRFLEVGIASGRVHNKMTDEARAEVIRKFRARELQVLVNVTIASYGFDCPWVDCLVAARPTKSLVLWLQCLGRGMRFTPDANECIAKGQRVLTDQGLCPIEAVTRAMRIWDGEDFVYHGGVESRGIKDVITYAGLTATPDHKVRTPERCWRLFGECASQGAPITSTGSGWTHLWEIDRHIVGDFPQRPWKQGTSFSEMHHVWRTTIGRADKSSAWRSWLSKLFPKVWRPGVVAPTLLFSAAALREPQRSKISSLWWSRDQFSIFLTAENGIVHSAEFRAQETPSNRSGRKRWRLLPRKHSLVDLQAELPKSKQRIKQVEVFDIVNCGPNHRFTVEGLLVSNCLVLDHADNTRQLGRAEDLYRWRLDEGKEAVANWTLDEASGEAEDAKSTTCEACQYIFSKSRVCPKCGWEVPFAKRDVETVDADLVLIGGAEAKRLPKGWPSHKIFYQMLFGYCDEKGYKRGWAYHRFKIKCGVAPDRNWTHLAAVPPDERVRNYLYYSGKHSGKKRRTAGVSR